MIKTDSEGRRWLLTGDIAKIDEEGYFFIVDRKKDMIIVSGFNVYPTDIEQVLYRHPKVQKVSVAGVPDQTTGVEARDQHLRSSDFFEIERYPKVTFRSTAVEWTGGSTLRVTGDLTVRGVTRPVALLAQYEGGALDPWGGYRVAFSASAEIDREDWGLMWNVALETGGVLVSKKVTLEIDTQAVLQQAPAAEGKDLANAS